MWWDAQQNIKAMPSGWKGPLTTSCGPRELWEKHNTASFCESQGLINTVKMKQVADGTSKTLLVGEQTMKPTSESARRRRSFWAYSYTSYNKSEVVPETRTMFSDYDRCVQFGDSNPCKRAWGTAHSNGTIQFAYTDGHVSSIPPSVDMQAFAAAASINGQEAVTAVIE
jgi:prepilin-type processing-associated H-X9-DG protein